MDATGSAGLTQISNMAISLFPVIGISGVVGYWIKARLDQNSDNKRKIRDEKEKQYKALLNNVLGFYKKWEDKVLQLQFMWEVYTNAAVYASDEVLRLAYNYIESFDKAKNVEDLERQQIYAKLVITIRNELHNITGEPESELDEKEIVIRGIDGLGENVLEQFLNNKHPS